MTFTEYCAQKGIELLREDIQYIRKQLLKRVPKTHHKAVALRYVEIWCKTLDNDKNAVTAQNRGRRAANLFLLEWSEEDAR